jgi:prepilin-type N-terminal cleavage/methylation domain-containing protein
MPPPTTTRSNAAGFSLIEVLVVITLIGLLMSFAAVSLGRYRETGRITDCRARIVALSLLAESYADRTGDYPPSRLAHVGVQDANDVNEGIEAFSVALRDRRYAGGRPDEQWLANGDDDHSSDLGSADGSDALLELVDPWDNPLLYFVHGDYGATAVYRLDDGMGARDVDVRPAMNPLTNSFHRFDSFQLRSTGPDGLLDTEDDLANYEIPNEDSQG